MCRTLNLALAIPLALAFGGAAQADPSSNVPTAPRIVTGAGPGAPGGHVKTFDGTDASLQQSFFAYPAFDGGVFVASGDISGDGTADVVTGAGDGAAGGHVKVFDGVTGNMLQSFFAYDGAFSGGVRVATGDINGDGFADIIAGAGAGAAGGHVKIFSGQTGELMHDFFAFDTRYSGGVSVGAGLYDGRASVIVGTLAEGTRVSIFQDFGELSAQAFGPLDAPSQPTAYASFFAYDGFTGGVYVAGSFGGAVPEPAVWMQLIFGFGLAGLAARRRRPVAA